MVNPFLFTAQGKDGKNQKILENRWNHDYNIQLNEILWKKNWQNRRQVNVNFLNSPFGQIEGKQDYRGLALLSFMYQNLKDIDLSYAAITAINRCILDHVKFDHATIRSHIKSNISNCSFVFADMHNITFNKDDEPILNTSFCKANMKGILASGLTFINCNFNAVSFKRASIDYCMFVNCTFSEADFSGGILAHCTFTGTAPKEKQLGKANTRDLIFQLDK